MTTYTVNNAIPFVPESTIDPAAGLNISLKVIDAIAQISVIRFENDPPVAPDEGDRYVVDTVPTGVWIGHAGELVQYLDAAWHFYNVNYVVNLFDDLIYIKGTTGWLDIGVSNPSLQQGYSGGATPEIITTTPRGPVTIKRGSAADTDSLFELKNAADDVVALITAEGDIIGAKYGLFGYLPAPVDTTITTAETYTPVLGTFTLSVIEGFGLATVNPPGTKYLGNRDKHFKLDWYCSVSANVASTTVRVGVKKNTVLIPGSVTSSFCKNADDAYSLSGCCVISLSKDDEIQLVATSDGDGDVITFIHANKIATEFFD
jgi:hypothetical protein